MKMVTNCKNCGAVLHGSKCEYCKTEYGEQRGDILLVKDPLRNAMPIQKMYDDCSNRTSCKGCAYIRGMLCEVAQLTLVSRGSLYSSVTLAACEARCREIDEA